MSTKRHKPEEFFSKLWQVENKGKWAFVYITANDRFPPIQVIRCASNECRYLLDAYTAKWRI